LVQHVAKATAAALALTASRSSYRAKNAAKSAAARRRFASQAAKQPVKTATALRRTAAGVAGLAQTVKKAAETATLVRRFTASAKNGPKQIFDPAAGLRWCTAGRMRTAEQPAVTGLATAIRALFDHRACALGHSDPNCNFGKCFHQTHKKSPSLFLGDTLTRSGINAHGENREILPLLGY
jgi:hypothetical protein